MTCVTARGLRKSFGKTTALDRVDLSVGEGRIVGLLGPNGAGKSTALQAMLGLIPYEGELRVLGRDPWTARAALMREVSFVADVAVLPRWLKVGQALDYMAGVHPGFDRARAEAFLARTSVQPTQQIKQLSKGMVVQLHLALVMAVDARLLVLDEPTLGLDLIYRKTFYDALLNDYFDGGRTIIVSTHDVDEVQHILTDVIVLDRGRVRLTASMDEVADRFVEVAVAPDRLVAARALAPITERAALGRTTMLFDGRPRDALARLGEVRTPSLAEVFSAVAAPAPAREAAA